MRKPTYLLACTSLAWACTANEASNLNDPATPGAHQIVVEAEQGDVRPPFQVEADETTSGGQYVWVPNYITKLRFNVGQEGTYKIWGRVFCAAGNEDSFNLRVDDNDPFNWNNIAHSDTWIWDEVHEKETVKTFKLSVGEHTLSLRPREDGSRLDRILVTNDLNYTPEGNPKASTKPTEGKEYVWMEAEVGDVKAPYSVEYHHTASGSKHISVPTQVTRFKVDIPEAGTYRLFAKVYAEAGNENSIKLRLGDQGRYRGWNAVPEDKFNQWIWEEVDLDNKTPGKTTFSLEKGPVSIWMRYREEGLKIDKFIITDDQAFQPENEATMHTH